MTNRMILRLVAVLSLMASTTTAGASWKAGVGKVVITPTSPTWMAGYGARKAPSEGADHDLWSKALMIEDEKGVRNLIVTLDLCGIDRDYSNAVRDEVKSKFGVDRSRVVLACSHTHSGPVIGSNLLGMYPLDETQRQRVADYSKELHAKIIESVGLAAKNLEAVELSFGIGRCDFGVNRRTNDQPRAAELRTKLALRGPVDHDVPVLRVGSKTALKAIVCGYACHCTTLSGQKFSGDYAGYAQIDIEKSHPETQAMFIAGCGADQNPLPRGTVAHAETYGRMLAKSVEQVIQRKLAPLDAPLDASYEEIPLALSTIPSKDKWTKDLESPELATRSRAKAMLATLDKGESIPTTYPYPVQVWRFGDALTWVFLGGEVVVDFSLRLKANLDPERTWVSAYCNDVMAYIPSLRVLKEGGYEGGGAMVYYGLPAPWSENVEEQIFDALGKMMRPH
jgi:neutral ceramidase